MRNVQSISPRFLKGLHANIAYWQQKTKNISDENVALLHPEFPNLLRAVQLGMIHPTTYRPAAELVCQAFFWIEQTSQWDSWLPLLERLISKVDDEILRCRLYLQQGQLYRSKQQSDAATGSLFESIKYAKMIQNDLLLAEARLHLSMTYLQKRDFAASESYAQQALKYFSAIDGVNKQLSGAYFTLGRASFMQGDYAQSESYLTQAVAYGKLEHSLIQLSRILTALAITLYRQGKQLESEKVYLEAIHIIDGTISTIDKVRLQLSLGTLYVDMNRLTDAENLFLDANHTLKRFPAQQHLQAIAANNLGNVLLEKGEPVAAESQLRLSVKLRRALNLRLPLANSCKSWGKALYHLGNLQKANMVINESLSILSEFKNDSWANEIRQACLTLQKEIEQKLSE